MQDKDIVEVYAAANVSEAYLVRNLLEDHGVQAHVVADALCGAAGDLPLGMDICPRIWVTKADCKRAREIITQQKDDQRSCEAGDVALPWMCPKCGSEVPENFDTCWNCEHSRIPT